MISNGVSFVERVTAIYHVEADAGTIETQARAIAIEQSVEMQPSAISDERVLRDIVGEVRRINRLDETLFEVRIGLAPDTTGYEAGQLLNILFGNTSLHANVSLADVEFPAPFAEVYGGPNRGLEGLRALVRANGRALTCTALKPQGLPPIELAALAGRFAAGGIDFVKDDHGLADQRYSPFADRVRSCAKEIDAARRSTGSHTRYVPNLSGDLFQAYSQAKLAAEEGIEAVLVEPMILGLANFHRLVREFPSLAFFAHPAMAGAARIAPPLLLGKIFRMLGADAVIYPSYGGRFGYTLDTCRAIATQARKAEPALKRAIPAPAGGMTVDRVPELLDFYGTETMLLIGGSLLMAGANLAQETSRFVESVARYGKGGNHGIRK